MPRKSDFGKYILSAGEIGAFTVCPEAWRLRTVQKVQGLKSLAEEKGMLLHDEWAKRCGETVQLTRVALTVIALVALAMVVYALMYHEFILR